MCKLLTKLDGSPVDNNTVYDKLLTGELMLSPYILWTIELIKTNAAPNRDPLAQYADVDLELVGEG